MTERELLEKLVDWYESEGEKELSATYGLAWVHGYRTIHDPNKPTLAELVGHAKQLLAGRG